MCVAAKFVINYFRIELNSAAALRILPCRSTILHSTLDEHMGNLRVCVYVCESNARARDRRVVFVPMTQWTTSLAYPTC